MVSDVVSEEKLLGLGLAGGLLPACACGLFGGELCLVSHDEVKPAVVLDVGNDWTVDVE